MMNKTQVKVLQHKLNKFTTGYHLGVAPLMVDGDIGPSSARRIRESKWWLGFDKNHRGPHVTEEFLWALGHVHARGASKGRQARARRGTKRRVNRRAWLTRNQFKAYLKPGVGTFDGKPVAKTAIPILRWARANGWKGQLNSGWRDPKFSEHLCIVMCGHTTCPGRCAGLSSNHVGNSPSRFAIDVTDYTKFAQLMRDPRCPKPDILNALGAQDPVHFSPSGR